MQQYFPVRALEPSDDIILTPKLINLKADDSKDFNEFKLSSDPRNSVASWTRTPNRIGHPINLSYLHLINQGWPPLYTWILIYWPWPFKQTPFRSWFRLLCLYTCLFLPASPIASLIKSIFINFVFRSIATRLCFFRPLRSLSSDYKLYI